MKKLLIIITTSLIAVTALIAAVFYWTSLREVSFTLENTSSVTVFNSDDKDIAKLQKDDTLRLRKGSYYVIPEGDNISADKITFKVEDSDLEVHVNPPFSDNYLHELLDEELPTIKESITSKYPKESEGYVLDKAQLYGRGEWAGGLLAIDSPATGHQRDPYRIVLHKKDGEWQVVRRPEYILTASRYSEVPIEVLREINQIVP